MSLWEDAIGYGTHADRPAPGAVGAVYFESDTGNGYRDNGTSWDRVTGPAVLPVQTVSEDTTLTLGNRLVLVTTDGVTVTLPPAAEHTGELIYLRALPVTTVVFTVAVQEGETAIDYWGTPGSNDVTVASTGTQWIGVD